MQLIVTFLISGLAVYAGSELLGGVSIDSWQSLLLVVILLAVVNAFVKPILVLLTLPATILSLGLFLLVINAFMVLLVAYILPGFSVDTFWWALAYSVIISLITAALGVFK